MQQIIRGSLFLLFLLFVLFLMGCAGNLRPIEQADEEANKTKNELTPLTARAITKFQIQFPPEEKFDKTLPLLAASEVLLEAINHVSILRDLAFSLNGEWIIQDISRGDGLYSVASTISSDALFVEQANLEPSLVYYALGWRLRSAWSPNNNAFYVAATDKPAAGCPYTHIVIHSIEVDKIRSTTFNGVGLGDCIVASWSPDGESLAITASNAKAIYIVDRNAQVKQTIVFDFGDHYYSIHDIFWLTGGIILNTEHFGLSSEVALATSNESPHRYATMLVELEGMGNQSIFSDDTNMFHIIAADPDSQKILVKQWNYTDIEEQLIMYNLETKRIEAVGSIMGNIGNRYQGIAPHVRLSMQDKDSKDWFCCWSFNWETAQIEYLGDQNNNYASLLSWYAPENGYIVITDMEDPKNSIAIVRP